MDEMLLVQVEHIREVATKHCFLAWLKWELKMKDENSVSINVITLKSRY